MAEPVASTSIAPPEIVSEETNDLYNELFSYGGTDAQHEEANEEEEKVDVEPSAPGTLPVVLQNVSEESVDIYSGIFAPEFLTPKRRRKSHEIQSMYEQCLQAASALEIQNRQLLAEMTVVKEENDRLKKNISSLYQTAKAEVGRKDKEIYRLRKQVWHLQGHLNNVRKQIVPPAAAPAQYPQQITTCMESSMSEENMPRSNGFHGGATNSKGVTQLVGGRSSQSPGTIVPVPVHHSDKSFCLAENASPKKRSIMQRTLDKAREIRSKYRDRDRRQSAKESSRKTSEAVRRRSDTGKSLEQVSTSRNLDGERKSRDDKDSDARRSSRPSSNKRSRSNDSCKSRDSKRSRSDYDHRSPSGKRRSQERHRKEDDRRKSRSTRDRRRDYSDDECVYPDCWECERERDRSFRSGERWSVRQQQRDHESHGRNRRGERSVSLELKASRRDKRHSPDRKSSKPKTPGRSRDIVGTHVKDSPGRSRHIVGTHVKDSPARSDSKSRYSSSPKKPERSGSERSRSRDRNHNKAVDVLRTDDKKRSKRDDRVPDVAEKNTSKTETCADEGLVGKKSGALDQRQMEQKTQLDSKEHRSVLGDNLNKNERLEKEEAVDDVRSGERCSGKNVKQREHGGLGYETVRAKECKSHKSGEVVGQDDSSVVKVCDSISEPSEAKAVAEPDDLDKKHVPVSKREPEATNVAECNGVFVQADKVGVKLDQKNISESDNAGQKVESKSSAVSEKVEKNSKTSVAGSEKVKFVTKASVKQMPGDERSAQSRSRNEKSLKKSDLKSVEMVMEKPQRNPCFSEHLKSSQLPVQQSGKADSDFEPNDKQGLVEEAQGQGQGKGERKLGKNIGRGENEPKRVSPKKNVFNDYCSKEKMAPVIESTSTLDRLFGEQDEIQLVDVADFVEAPVLPSCENAMELPGTDSPLKSKKTGYGSISQALRFSKEGEHVKKSTGSIDKLNSRLFIGEDGISCTGREETEANIVAKPDGANVQISGSISHVVSTASGQVDCNTFDTVGSNTFDTVSSVRVNTAYDVGNSTMDNLGLFSNAKNTAVSKIRDTSDSNLEFNKEQIDELVACSYPTADSIVRSPEKQENESSDALNKSVTGGSQRDDLDISRNSSNSFSALDTSGCGNLTNSSYSNAKSSQGSVGDHSRGSDLNFSNVEHSARSQRHHGERLTDDEMVSVSSGSEAESDARNVRTSPLSSPEKRIRRRTCSVSFEVSDNDEEDSGEERSESEPGDEGISGSGSEDEGQESEVEERSDEEEEESDASVEEEEEEVCKDSGSEAEEQSESEAELDAASQSGLEGVADAVVNSETDDESGNERGVEVAADSGDEEERDEENDCVEESDLETAESGDESDKSGDKEQGSRGGSTDEELQVSEESADESDAGDSDAEQLQSDADTDSEEEGRRAEKVMKQRSDYEAAESDQEIQESDRSEEYSEDESEQSDADSSEDEARPDRKVLESDKSLRVSHGELGSDEVTGETTLRVPGSVNTSQLEMEALELEKKKLVKEMQSLDQESQESKEMQRFEELVQTAKERLGADERSVESQMEVEGNGDEDVEEGELTSDSEGEADQDTALDGRVGSERLRTKVLGTMRGDQPKRPVHERLGLLPSGTKKRARSPEHERLTPPKKTRRETRSGSRERPRTAVSRHLSTYSGGHRSPRSDRGKSSEHARSSHHDRKQSPHRVRRQSPHRRSPVSERRKPARDRRRSRDRIQSLRGRRSTTPKLRSPHRGRSSSLDHSRRRLLHEPREHSHERSAHSHERRKVSSVAKKVEPNIRERRSSHNERVKSGSRVTGRPSSKKDTKLSSRSRHSRSPGTSRSRRRSSDRQRSCSSRSRSPNHHSHRRSRSGQGRSRSPYMSRARRRSTDRHSSCSRSRSPRHRHTTKTSVKRQDSRPLHRTDRRRSCTSGYSCSRSRSPALRHHAEKTSGTSRDKPKSDSSRVRSSNQSNSRRSEHSSKGAAKSSSAAHTTSRGPGEERSNHRERSSSELKRSTGARKKDNIAKSKTDISRPRVKSGGDGKRMNRDESIEQMDDMDCEVTIEAVDEVVSNSRIKNKGSCTKVQSSKTSPSTDPIVAEKRNKPPVLNKASDSLENGQQKPDANLTKMKISGNDTLKVKKSKNKVSGASLRKSHSETSVVYKKVKSVESANSNSKNSVVKTKKVEKSTSHQTLTVTDRVTADDEGLVRVNDIAASKDTLKSHPSVNTKTKNLKVRKSSSCGNLKKEKTGGSEKMEIEFQLVEIERKNVDKSNAKPKKSPSPRKIKVKPSKSQESLGEMSISEKVVSSKGKISASLKDCKVKASCSADLREETDAGSSGTVLVSSKQMENVAAPKLKKSVSASVVKSPKVKPSPRTKKSLKLKGSSSEKVGTSSPKSDTKTAVKSYELDDSSSNEKVAECKTSSSSENVRVKLSKPKKSSSSEKLVKSAELKENQSSGKYSRTSGKPIQENAEILVDSAKPKGSNSAKASSPKSSSSDVLHMSVKRKTSSETVRKSKSKESLIGSLSQVDAQGDKTKSKKKSVSKNAGSSNTLC